MRKSLAIFACAALALTLWGCGGPSAEEQEKMKQDIIQMETANTQVDSTMFEVQKTSQELDALLNQLEAQ